MPTILAAIAVSFLAQSTPTFSNGPQFPGATGGIRQGEDAIRIDYDFSGGGHYVSAEFNGMDPVRENAIRFRAEMPDDVTMNLRFVDSEGQTFVKELRQVTAGNELYEIRLDGKGPYWHHWNGKNDGVVRPPVKDLAFSVENRVKGAKGGGRGTAKVSAIEFYQDEFGPAGPFDENLYEATAKEFGRLEAKFARDGAKSAKTRAVLAVAKDFLSWIRDDLAHGTTNRAIRETKELGRLLRNEAARQARIAVGEEGDFARADGPFRYGFGHFKQTVTDMEMLEPLANDIIQIELGPSVFYPQEGVVNTNAVEYFVRAADKAQKLGMKICLLLSPHYMPEWALKKWPTDKACGDGMIHYCAYNEHMRAFLKRYFELVVPLVKDHPALHSLCLSNEPVSSGWGGGCSLRPRLAPWLKGRYRDIAELNAKWGTSYASFEDVKLPQNFYAFKPFSPEAVELTRFNRESFAEFHSWMAGEVSRLAPGVPLHSKIMIHANFTGGTSFYSVDPELFSPWSAFGGNDCSDYVTHGDGVWAHDFAKMEAGYDYLRSVSRKPIFNSENHIIDDAELRPIPEGHVYTVLWQNAIHGLECSTTWYWERAYNERNPWMCFGLFLDRPTGLSEIAFAPLDLNRLSREVRAIAARKPTVLLHWSLSSLVMEKRDGAAFLHAYRAASCLGQPLGVATEKMLADYAATGKRVGALEDVRAVVLPDASYLPDAVRAGLKRLEAEGVKVVVVGRKPTKNDFNEPRDGDQFGFLGKFGERELAAALFVAAKGWHLPAYPRAVSPDGREAFGVESSGVVIDGVRYLSVVNHRRAEVRMRFPAAGTDLITGRAVSVEEDLKPESPMLVRIDPQLHGDGVHDDTAAIQAMLDAGRALVELPAPKKEYLISKTLRLGDGQELRLPRFARVKLTDGSNCHMVGVRDEKRSVRDIAVTGGIWDMNNLGQRHNLAAHYYVGPENRHRWLDLKKEYVQTHTHRMQGVHEPDYFLGVCMRFFNVKGLSIRGVTIRNPVCYGIQLWKASDFTVDDVTFDYQWGNPSKANMDGLHLDGHCHRGRITNLKGICFDDFVAINATDGSDSPEHGPIDDIDINGIFCDYCHSAVRLLSRSSQDAVRRIHISDVHGRYYSYGIGFTYFHKDIVERGVIDGVVISDCRMSRSDTPADTWRFTPFGLIEFEPGVDIGSVTIDRLVRDESERPEIDTIRIREGAEIARLTIRDCEQVNRTETPMYFLHNRGKIGKLVHENTRMTGPGVLETDVAEERDFTRRIEDLEHDPFVSHPAAKGYPKRAAATPYGRTKAGFEGADVMKLLAFTGPDANAEKGVVDTYTENDEAGYYCVVYTNFDIRVECVAEGESGYFRMRFPEEVERKCAVDGGLAAVFSVPPTGSKTVGGKDVYSFAPGYETITARISKAPIKDREPDIDRAGMRSRQAWWKAIMR